MVVRYTANCKSAYGAYKSDVGLFLSLVKTEGSACIVDDRMGVWTVKIALALCQSPRNANKT